jgi:hypothetical protein
MTEYTTGSQRYKDAKADLETLRLHQTRIKGCMKILETEPLKVTDQSMIYKDMLTLEKSMSHKIAVLSTFVSLVLDDEIPF